MTPPHLFSSLPIRKYHVETRANPPQQKMGNALVLRAAMVCKRGTSQKHLKDTS